MFVFYIYHHNNALRTTHQANVAQEVMNVVHMIQATPKEQLERAIRTIENPHLKVTLSPKPAYNHKVRQPTFWHIKKLIVANTRTLSVSIHLASHQWLNVQATLLQSQSIWPHMFMLLAELFTAAIVLFYAWSINRFIVPLKDFQVVAQGLGITLKTTMLKNYKGPRVIQETAEAMNKMQQRIKDLVCDRTLMLAAISHDLKTPITRLKLRAHLLDSPQLKQDVLYDLDEMETMISELLIFSKNENENESETEHRKKLELNSFIETLCHELSDMSFDVTFHRVEQRVIFLCRKIAFKRALNNIIQNAVKYGSKADVYLFNSSDKLLIHVDDQGPGIDENEFEKVFSPFYRLDYSRSRDIAGTGLGLAIARSAIRSHGGDITLSNRDAGGLRVTFSFPL